MICTPDIKGPLYLVKNYHPETYFENTGGKLGFEKTLKHDIWERKHSKREKIILKKYPVFLVFFLKKNMIYWFIELIF